MKKKKTFPVAFLTVFLIPVLTAGIMETTAFFNERPLAMVTRMIPNLAVKNLEKDTTAAQGFELFSGDTLRTDDNGFAFVAFMDRSTARVRPQSQLVVSGEIDRDQNSQTRIDLNEGEILIDLEKRPNNEMEVYSTNTVASVKGTRFGARHTGYFWVAEGEVEVTLIETGEAVTLTAGMFARISEDGNSLETGILTDEELAELESDYRIIEQELIERRIILKFRDANGQLREEEVIYYEHQD